MTSGNTMTEAIRNASFVITPILPENRPRDPKLAGKSITAETAEAAGKAAVEGAQPLSQNAYKVTLARVAVKRALLEAAACSSKRWRIPRSNTATTAPSGASTPGTVWVRTAKL